MDDVPKLQQINNIARELMKHGQANSMEDAIRMATQKVEGGNPAPQMPHMPEAPKPPEEQQGQKQEGQEQEAQTEEKPEETQTEERPEEQQNEAPAEQKPETPEEQKPAEPVQELPEKEEVKGEGADERLRSVEDILARQQTAVSKVTTVINEHTKNIEQIGSKINDLIAELTTLKQEVEKLKNSPVTPPMKPKQAQQGQTQFKKEEQPKPAEEKKKEGGGHARSGNYNPDDVSIEKFFYYGNR